MLTQWKCVPCWLQGPSGSRNMSATMRQKTTTNLRNVGMESKICLVSSGILEMNVYNYSFSESVLCCHQKAVPTAPFRADFIFSTDRCLLHKVWSVFPLVLE